jgi:hypothetical protein
MKIALLFYMQMISGFKSRGPGFYSWRYKILCVAVGVERGPLSLVTINENLLQRKVAAPHRDLFADVRTSQETHL